MTEDEICKDDTNKLEDEIRTLEAECKRLEKELNKKNQESQDSLENFVLNAIVNEQDNSLLFGDGKSNQVSSNDMFAMELEGNKNLIMFETSQTLFLHWIEQKDPIFMSEEEIEGIANAATDCGRILAKKVIESHKNNE